MWAACAVCVAMALALLAMVTMQFYGHVRASLLEFMLTLIAGSVPSGLLMRLAYDSGAFVDLDRLPFAVAVALVPFALALLGTAWALPRAEVLGVRSVWLRLGMMLVGWALVPAVFAFGFGLCAVMPRLLGAEVERLPTWLYAALLSSGLVFLPFVLIDRKYRRSGDAWTNL